MKNNIKYLFLFIGLIMVIGGLLLFNYLEEHHQDNVDRKVEYLFPELTYDKVLNMGKELILNGVELLNINNYTYEKDESGNIMIYAINAANDYKKITNFNLINSTLSKSNLTKFMNAYKIIYEEGDYYIEDYKKEYNLDYIGSKVTIKDYNAQEVTLKLDNYYNSNIKYVGIINDDPLDSEIKTTYVTLVYENKSLRIKDYQEILKIII